jgi:hypothetical protein
MLLPNHVCPLPYRSSYVAISGIGDQVAVVLLDWTSPALFGVPEMIQEPSFIIWDISFLTAGRSCTLGVFVTMFVQVS